MKDVESFRGEDYLNFRRELKSGGMAGILIFAKPSKQIPRKKKDSFACTVDAPPG